MADRFAVHHAQPAPSSSSSPQHGRGFSSDTAGLESSSNPWLAPQPAADEVLRQLSDSISRLTPHLVDALSQLQAQLWAEAQHGGGGGGGGGGLDLEAAFELLDVDGSGVLEVNEFPVALEPLGIAQDFDLDDAEMRALGAILDVNGDDYIDEIDFAASLRALQTYFGRVARAKVKRAIFLEKKMPAIHALQRAAHHNHRDRVHVLADYAAQRREHNRANERIVATQPDVISLLGRLEEELGNLRETDIRAGIIASDQLLAKLSPPQSSIRTNARSEARRRNRAALDEHAQMYAGHRRVSGMEVEGEHVCVECVGACVCSGRVLGVEVEQMLTNLDALHRKLLELGVRDPHMACGDTIAIVKHRKKEKQAKARKARLRAQELRAQAQLFEETGMPGLLGLLFQV